MRKKFISAFLALGMVNSLFASNDYMVHAKSVVENRVQKEADFAPGEVIVSMNTIQEYGIEEESVLDRIGARVVKQLDKAVAPGEKYALEEEPEHVFLLKIKGNEKQDVLDAIKVLEKDPDVRYAEPNYYVTLEDDDDKDKTNDTYYDDLWGVKKVSAPICWNVTKGSKDFVIGIIDTGIDYNHEDLAQNIWTNPGEIPGDGIDNDGNGYIDDIHGWDFLNNDNDPMDDKGHGTHVAGTIGAVGNNNKGVIGICPNVKMAALKFLGTKDTTTANAVEALHYANTMGFPITSNSWGGGGYSQALHDEIQNGGLFVASAGNSGTDNDQSAHYPSSYDCDNIIAVANTTATDELSGSSCYGATSVDLAAPGTRIYSTIPGNGYGYKSGTSMATPHVSGAAALLLSYYPQYSSMQLKNAILDNVDRVQGLTGKMVTGGRLNVAKAFGPVSQYQGVDYSSVYDYYNYSNAFQDVHYVYSKNPIQTLRHFVETGMKEGRPASKEFSPRAYRERYKDLDQQFGDNWSSYYTHYMNTGKEQHRLAAADILLGDLNGDGVVDENDRYSMASVLRFYNIGKSEGTNWYDGRGDLDFDLDIDQDDVRILDELIASNQ